MSQHEEGEVLSSSSCSSSLNNLTSLTLITILPIDSMLEIYTYCNLDDLRNLMNTSIQFYKLIQSSEAHRVWRIQLDELMKKRSISRRKPFKNESFQLLDSDFERVGKNDNIIINRTTVLIKVIRKQQRYYLSKLLNCKDLNILEQCHKHPRFYNDFKSIVNKRLFNIWEIDPSSLVYLLEYDPFYFFKCTFVTSDHVFLLTFCKFLFLKDRSNELHKPTQFLQTWKQMSIEQLEPNVKIWKEFYHKRFMKDTNACVIAYFHLPYQLHDGEYKTANEMVRIKGLEYLPTFIQEFFNGCSKGYYFQFEQLIDPFGPERLGYESYYFYQEDKKTGKRTNYYSK